MYSRVEFIEFRSFIIFKKSGNTFNTTDKIQFEVKYTNVDYIYSIIGNRVLFNINTSLNQNDNIYSSLINLRSNTISEFSITLKTRSVIFKNNKINFSVNYNSKYGTKFLNSNVINGLSKVNNNSVYCLTNIQSLDYLSNNNNKYIALGKGIFAIDSIKINNSDYNNLIIYNKSFINVKSNTYIISNIYLSCSKFKKFNNIENEYIIENKEIVLNNNNKIYITLKKINISDLITNKNNNNLEYKNLNILKEVELQAAVENENKLNIVSSKYRNNNRLVCNCNSNNNNKNNNNNNKSFKVIMLTKYDNVYKYNNKVVINDKSTFNKNLNSINIFGENDFKDKIDILYKKYSNLNNNNKADKSIFNKLIINYIDYNEHKLNEVLSLINNYYNSTLVSNNLINTNTSSINNESYNKVFELSYIYNDNLNILLDEIVGIPCYNLPVLVDSQKYKYKYYYNNKKQTLIKSIVMHNYKNNLNIVEDLNINLMEINKHKSNVFQTSSFLEMSTNFDLNNKSKQKTEKIENEILNKIEKSINIITDKIVFQSDKINQIEKINKELIKQIENYETGNHSIQLIEQKLKSIEKDQKEVNIIYKSNIYFILNRN